ncbi:MAG: adenosylmethionine--8-amino-7-oxononanoate transaminase [Ktedonobacteraceae bacterium]|nr:adenosylmethionine--8-amino-7-oxononanoate transaminase [Ktedonobacteraceae bacterium]
MIRKGRILIEQADKRYLWHPFTQQQDWEAEPQVVIERAEGSYLIDITGKRYLDGVASLWVNVHGHRRQEINRAIKDQLERVAHTTLLGLTHPSAIELARRLIEIAPGELSRVFYSDTGAAAMEIALKMALQYWQQCNPPRPRKTKFFSLCNAYHGDTVGAMSVGGIDLFQRAYHQLLFPILQARGAYCYRCHLHASYPACRFACLDEVEQMIAEHADELAAVVMEPMVQGAAGMLVYPAGYTRAVWEIAKRHQVLFIVDEVATGFGKTGTMFACEHEGIEPDVMALGKGITGGYLPLAATLTTEQIYRAFLGTVEQQRTFYHGHTYTGNPLACAAALASLDLFEQDQTLQQLQPKIALLSKELERFKQLSLVGDIRQCGFMVGIELVQDKQTRLLFPGRERVAVRVTKEARRRGVIIRPLSDILVVMPPLSISEEELGMLLNVTYDSIVSILGSSLRTAAKP